MECSGALAVYVAVIRSIKEAIIEFIAEVPSRTSALGTAFVRLEAAAATDEIRVRTSSLVGRRVILDVDDRGFITAIREAPRDETAALRRMLVRDVYLILEGRLGQAVSREALLRELAQTGRFTEAEAGDELKRLLAEGALREISPELYRRIGEHSFWGKLRVGR